MDSVEVEVMGRSVSSFALPCSDWHCVCWYVTVHGQNGEGVMCGASYI